jgi:hypothetical protein
MNNYKQGLDLWSKHCTTHRVRLDLSAGWSENFVVSDFTTLHKQGFRPWIGWPKIVRVDKDGLLLAMPSSRCGREAST